MKFNQKLAQRLLLGVTPLVTGSIFVALPGFAATEAASGAKVDITNFSHNPLSTSTLTDTNTSTITTNGQVAAEAQAVAGFLVNPNAPLTQAGNISFSTTKGDGSNYLGQAQSTAGLIGYNFLVGEGETFSFKFNAFLGLGTSIDNPSSENANAAGDLAFLLYDSNDMKNPLEFFNISGKLASASDDDFLNIQKSTGVTIEASDTSSSFGGNQESVFASIQGLFSRTFEKLTSLILVEGKTNKADSCAWH